MKNPFSVLGNYLRLRKEQWLDLEELESLGEKRLHRITGYAGLTKHYRGVLEGSDGIPVTEKRQVISDPYSFLTQPAERLARERTSGSSGVHTDLFFDRPALEYRAALTTHDQLEFGRRPSDLYLEITHYNIPPFPLARFGIFRKKSLSVFADQKSLFRQVRNARPDILAWYPSVTSVMAKMNDERGRPLKLKSVYSGAELLTDRSRKLIEDSFSCPVFNQYASTEFGVIAWECPEEHSLHVNSNSMLVEIVDSKGKPKRSGTGRVIITGFFNKAMPLLRYSIGDLASWGKECSCGRGLPVLKSLEGRDDDKVILPSGKEVSARAINLMDDIHGVLLYQIVQERSDLFVFRFVPSEKGLSDGEKARAADIIRRGCSGEEVQVEFEEVRSIGRGRTGKIKTVVSKVR